jgi:UDP-N-acetylmuramate--alanine ligase
VVAIFQPHRYSRTLHCREGFRTAFLDADVVLVTDIYAAGEEPIDGVSAAALVEDIRAASRPEQEILHAGDLARARAEATSRFRDGDLLLCLGAGSITQLAGQLADQAASAPAGE